MPGSYFYEHKEKVSTVVRVGGGGGGVVFFFVRLPDGVFVCLLVVCFYSTTD